MEGAVRPPAIVWPSVRMRPAWDKRPAGVLHGPRLRQGRAQAAGVVGRSGASGACTPKQPRYVA
nr:hypothetical protein HUO10_004532 [Paraburkholderia busanensis]